jgi:hypothetical protein
MILDNAVCCEGCITEHKQAVGHSVYAEQYFRTGSTGQGYHGFLPNVVADIGDIRIIF